MSAKDWEVVFDFGQYLLLIIVVLVIYKAFFWALEKLDD